MPVLEVWQTWAHLIDCAHGLNKSVPIWKSCVSGTSIWFSGRASPTYSLTYDRKRRYNGG